MCFFSEISLRLYCYHIANISPSKFSFPKICYITFLQYDDDGDGDDDGDDILDGAGGHDHDIRFHNPT